MATPHLDDAVFCSHTTCNMVEITPKSGLVGHGDENATPYMVMKITHSNEETKCQKHTSKHSTDATEQLIVPQKRTNEKDEAAATQKATRTGKRQDTFEDTNNHGF